MEELNLSPRENWTVSITFYFFIEGKTELQFHVFDDQVSKSSL